MLQFKNSSPIFGARTHKQLEDNLTALDFELNENQISSLNQLAKIEGNFPNDFLQLPRIKEILYANQLDKIEK